MLVTKPWGREIWIEQDPDKQYLIKRIYVNPHSKLSLQRHNKREEFWLCISKEVTVRVCPVENLTTETPTFKKLEQGKTIHIPLGQVHQLINHTDEEACILEVQYGICEDSDIIRYEDDYGRDINVVLAFLYKDTTIWTT